MAPRACPKEFKEGQEQLTMCGKCRHHGSSVWPAAAARLASCASSRGRKEDNEGAAQLILARAVGWRELVSTETSLRTPGPIACLPTGAALVGDLNDCRLKLLSLRPDGKRLQVTTVAGSGNGEEHTDGIGVAAGA